MKFKGTPGPWKATDSTDIVDSNGFSHVEVTNLAVLADWYEKGFAHWSASEKAHRKIPHEEQIANACLIAAAPELLDALIELRKLVAYHDQADAAINKALGVRQ